MGLVETGLALAVATKTNGAQEKAAAGGLPARITAEDEYFFDAGADCSSICFGADEASIWVMSGTTVRQYSLSGTLLQTVAGATNGWSLIRIDANTMWCSRNTAAAQYFEITELGVLTGKTLPLTGQRLIAKLGTTGWCNPAGTVTTEFVLATGAATGRTITTAAVASIWSSSGDGTPGLYMTVGATILKYEDLAGTMTLTKTWTVSGMSPVPGSSVGNEMIVDSIGRPIVKHGNVQAYDRFSIAAGAQKDVAERIVWGGPEIAGMAAPTTGGGAQSSPGHSLSPTEKYLAYLVPSADMVTADRGVRIKNLQTQRARWAFPVTADSTIARIMVPGELGGQIGVTVGWRAGATQDFRRVRCYYSLNGGGSRTEFTPNATVSIPVTIGQTVTIDVDFNAGFGIPGGPLPWVGAGAADATGDAAAGEGIAVLYEDPLVGGVVVPPDPPGGPITATTFEIIRDNYYAVIRALLPRRLANIRYDFVDDEPLVTWATRMPSSQVFRKCELIAIGEQPPQSPIIEPNAQERRLLATFTVAYPVLENLVGKEKYRELEDVMRDDAAQLHDALFWSDNYVSGQSACMVTIGAPARLNDQLYLQTLSLQIDFYEATVLG